MRGGVLGKPPYPISFEHCVQPCAIRFDRTPYLKAIRGYGTARDSTPYRNHYYLTPPDVILLSRNFLLPRLPCTTKELHGTWLLSY